MRLFLKLVGKILKSILVIVLVGLAIGIAWFPWRPSALRQQPRIVETESSVSLPEDVAALGLYAQYFKGFDLSPGRYTIEKLELQASWISDNLVQTYNGLLDIPLHPEDIPALKDLSLFRGFVNLTRLRDMSGQIVGIGSQVETIAFSSNPLKHVINADTDWTFVIPGRGVLFLSQEEGGPDLGALQDMAKKTGQELKGEWRINHTLGPLPNRWGIIHGGTGDFEGVVGVFQEYNIVHGVPPKGDIDANSEYKLTYIRPSNARSGPGQKLPEDVAKYNLPPTSLLRLDFDRPYEVKHRRFHLEMPRDAIYQTRGEQRTDAVIPASMPTYKAISLRKVTSLLAKIRDETGTVIGLAGATTVHADDRKYAQWTLTLPGEGTLHVLPDSESVPGGEAPAVLSSGGGHCERHRYLRRRDWHRKRARP